MSNADQDGTGAAPASPVATQTKPAERKHETVQALQPFNVILLNDNDHSYPYVITMLRRLFGHPEPQCMLLANHVDNKGRAIVFTTHRELAELKRDQILAFGADPRSRVPRINERRDRAGRIEVIFPEAFLNLLSTCA